MLLVPNHIVHKFIQEVNKLVRSWKRLEQDYTREIFIHCLQFAEMCITFFHLPGDGAAAGGYRLVLVMNRDEFLARPTAPASWRTEENG